MITLSKSRIAAACVALAACMPLQGHAGLLDDDEARKAIIDLRAKVENMARELNARIDTKSDRSSALDMVNQQEQTMSEIAKLRGQVEVLSNELANAQKRQKDLYADLDERMRKLEPRQVTIDGREAAVDPSEQRAYDAAMVMFKGGDYKSAAAALGDFVRRYPASVYAANAQYWLGNAHFAQRDFKGAIAAQEMVVSQYRDSPKAPDAILNIASSYTELKDIKNAKKALKELVLKYPDSSAAQAAKERLAVLK
ncbi:tol-pal system protein YbgF [Massilia sp. CCM 9210]|uniref:tol-pal system protein YbgF n=1 Tax=Massilia scottii TaxID=3057166 RepID=UPI002796964B|nr:tol-pal system protein YbgF [Massilia sp. CCM 9210]MDQ1816430.1 tol-pal system protein YbgF [Massilia sp. CCM 9210]